MNRESVRSSLLRSDEVDRYMRRNIQSALLIIILSFLTPVLLCAKDFRIIEIVSSNKLIKINGGKLNNIEQGATGRIYYLLPNKKPFRYADFRITEVGDNEAIAEVINPDEVVAVGHYLIFDNPPMGTLSITTNAPDAEVAIGKDIEKAPIINKILPPATYEIRISAQNYSPKIVKIVLGPGDIKSDNYPLEREKGRLIIETTPPGATVFINKIPKGDTNKTFNQLLEVGDYELIIKKGDFGEITRNITIDKDGLRIPLALERLPPEPALLEIDTDPGGATIFIDENEWPDKTPCTVEIKDAEVKLTIEKKHFRPYEEIIKRATLPRKIAPKLDQFEFKLSINSDPPEAKYTLTKEKNLINTGTTPSEVWRENGLYQLELEKPGYKKVGPIPISIDSNDFPLDPIKLKGLAKGSVSIDTNPVPGNIEIDGKLWGTGEQSQKIHLEEGPHKISIFFPNGAIYKETLDIEGGVDRPNKTYNFHELRNKLFNPCQYKLLSSTVSISVGIDDLTKKIPPPEVEYWVQQGRHQLVLDFPSDKKILKIRVQDDFANIGTRRIDLVPSDGPINEAKNIPGGDSFLNDVEHDFIRIISNRKYSMGVDKERDLEAPADPKGFTFPAQEMDSHEINLKPVSESGSFIITIELFKIRERRFYSVKLTFPE
jgi:hypothetical protein